MVRCFFFLLALIPFLVACGGSDVQPQTPINKLPPDHSKENLLEFDKNYVELEEKEINHYIDSLHLQMKALKDGVRYNVVNPGNAKKPKKGDLITLTYTVTLLDGTPCKVLTNKKTSVNYGKAKLPIGIESALSLLGEGGHGDFIIPAMIAYGVSGYEDCVPPYSPVRCSILLNSVQKQ